MADELTPEEVTGQEGPKDTTPNPMEEAEKAAGAEGAEKPAKDAKGHDETVEAEPADEKLGFIDSLGWTRALQILFILAGAYFVFMGISPDEFYALSAISGAILLTLAGLLEVHILKKFSKKYKPLDMGLRWGIFGLLAALTVFYIVQIWKPMTQVVNTDVLMYVGIAIAAVYLYYFILYILAHKGQISSDVLMLAGVVVAVYSLISFYLGATIMLSMILTTLATIAMIVGLNLDKSEGQDRDQIKVILTTLIVVFTAPIVVYMMTIFGEHRTEILSVAKISPDYKEKPENLSWSNDSWALVYNRVDKKNKTNRLNVIHGLTRGIAEITDSENEIQLPENISPAVWNKKGNFLIFSGYDVEKTDEGDKFVNEGIWGVSVDLRLIDLPEKLWKKYKVFMPEPVEDVKVKVDDKGRIIEPDKYIAHEDHRKEIKEKLIAEYPHAGYLFHGKIITHDDQLVKLAYEEEVKKLKDPPPGKPKGLVVSFDKIIDKKVKPILHKTAWAPDSENFVFSAENPKTFNLWKSNIKKQEIEKITKGKSKINPLWSPSGEKILYVSKTDSYTFLEIKNYDGSDPHELNINSSRDKKLFPLWDNREEKVIYLKDDRKAVIMNANATNQKDLSRKTLPERSYWMTDSKKKMKLRYTESGNIWRIFTLNPDGKGNKEIFKRICDSLSQPMWSYDGTSIVVGVNYEDSGEIWRMDKDGKWQTKLYTTKHAIRALEWAPESNRIAFITSKKGHRVSGADEKNDVDLTAKDFKNPFGVEELWVIDNDGRNPLNLYTTKGVLSSMAWDNQGKRVVFQEQYRKFYFRPDLKNIKVVNVIDGELWKLRPYDFYSESPVWTDDGDVISYVSWTSFWLNSAKSSIWSARIQ